MHSHPSCRIYLGGVQRRLDGKNGTNACGGSGIAERGKASSFQPTRDDRRRGASSRQ
jgi:hypothetical protein